MKDFNDMRKIINTYDLNGQTVNYYRGPGWRLIYDGVDVRNDIFFSNGITETTRQLKAFDTSGETLTEIIVLGLNYTPASDIKLNVDEYLSDL